MGLPSFNEVWEGLTAEERAIAVRHVGRAGRPMCEACEKAATPEWKAEARAKYASLVEAGTPGHEAYRAAYPQFLCECTKADRIVTAWVQVGDRRIDADPSVPYVPPKPPRPGPDVLARAASRLRAAGSDDEAAALLALVLKGEGV